MNLVNFYRIQKVGEIMATWLAILLIVVALIGGLALDSSLHVNI